MNLKNVSALLATFLGLVIPIGAAASGQTKVFESSVLEVSKNFLATGINQNVFETYAINQYINNVAVRGNGSMTGRSTLTLVENPFQIQMGIYFQGNAVNRTTGRAAAGAFDRKSVVVNSTSTFGLHGLKSVFFAEKGFALLPNKTNATACVQINNVTLFNGRGNVALLGQNIARNQTEANKASFAATGKAQAIRDLNARIDQEVNKNAALGHEQYLKDFYRPFIASKLYPGSIKTRSNPEKITIVTEQGDVSTQKNLAPRPEVPSESDVKFSFHKVLFNAITTKKFSGRKINFLEFRKELNELLGLKSEVKPEDQDYAISFPTNKPPLELKFNYDKFQLTIHSTGYYINDVRQPSMDVSAIYSLSITADGRPLATRTGELVILPPGHNEGDRLTDRQRDLQRNLRERYEVEFKREIISDPVKLPSPWNRSGKLMANYIHSDSGWLVMGWVLQHQ